ncbi:hypothetical protein E2C01_049404 [Portunus trituberculatus]|uniref:Uncharacterized protein n=1 Tax=Portunus trituberculatus TaxID=210409 RepID=A0A5B7GEC0_PORTR|nr:hypothetical protein [Portunus trituberculatus]
MPQNCSSREAWMWQFLLYHVPYLEQWAGFLGKRLMDRLDCIPRKKEIAALDIRLAGSRKDTKRLRGREVAAVVAR